MSKIFCAKIICCKIYVNNFPWDCVGFFNTKNRLHQYTMAFIVFNPFKIKSARVITMFVPLKMYEDFSRSSRAANFQV